jgi:GDP-L-fucose synthase
MKKNERIFLTGHTGLLGSAFYNFFKKNKFKNIITVPKKKLDLTNKNQVENFFKKKRPDVVIICAARVGGIMDNYKNPWDFIYINTSIQLNILSLLKKYKIKKTLIFGSSCIYPKISSIPIKEDALLSGHLEKTNEAYAISKITGLKLAEYLIKQHKIDVRSVMPCSLYGTNDHYFESEKSHFIPAMIHKIHSAKIKNEKTFEVWGSGKALREFLYSGDLVKISLKLLNISKKKYLNNIGSEFFYNLGSSKSYTILNIVKMLCEIIGYKGKIVLNRKYPDGTMNKTMSSNKIKKIIQFELLDFYEGLKITYKDYLGKYYKKNISRK